VTSTFIPHARPAQGPSAEALRLADDLARDHVYEVLQAVEGELVACLAALRNNDETGTRYHLRRIVIGVTAAAVTLSAKAMEAA
jgi:hypothetical protein